MNITAIFKPTVDSAGLDEVVDSLGLPEDVTAQVSVPGTNRMLGEDTQDPGIASLELSGLTEASEVWDVLRSLGEAYPENIRRITAAF